MSNKLSDGFLVFQVRDLITMFPDWCLGIVTLTWAWRSSLLVHVCSEAAQPGADWEQP